MAAAMSATVVPADPALKRAHVHGVVLYADYKDLSEGRVTEVYARIEERLRARSRMAGWALIAYWAWKCSAMLAMLEQDPLPVQELRSAVVGCVIVAPMIVYFIRRHHQRIADELRARLR